MKHNTATYTQTCCRTLPLSSKAIKVCIHFSVKVLSTHKTRFRGKKCHSVKKYNKRQRNYSKSFTKLASVDFGYCINGCLWPLAAISCFTHIHSYLTYDTAAHFHLNCWYFFYLNTIKAFSHFDS